MLKKIGRLIYYSLFFLTPLIVLKETSELFELNKMNLIYFSSISIAFILAVTMIRSKKLLVCKSAFDKYWVGFLGVMLLSTIVSIDRHTSIFGYYGRFNGGLLSLLSFSTLAYGFGFFFNKNDVIKILRISFFSSIVVIAWGLSGKFGHDFSCLVFTGQFNNSCWTDQFRPAERMFSTLGQPNWLGAYLAIHFFIGLFFILTNHFKRWYLSYAYLLLTFVSLISTKSRSALLAVGVGSLLYCSIVLLLKRSDLFKKDWKKWLFIGVLFLVSVVIFKTGIDKVDNLTQFTNGFSKNTKLQVSSSRLKGQLSSEVTESLDIRKIVWKGAVALGLKYPILGTGPETFGFSYYFTRPVEHNLTSEWDYIYNKAHNEYLNYLATTGFIGLIAYLVLVLVVIHSLIFEIRNLKSNSNEKLLNLTLLCSYVTILVTNFFGFSTSTINLFFFLIPAFVAVGQTNNKEYFAIADSEVLPQQKIQIGLAAVTYLFCLVWLLSSFVADTQYAQALAYEASDDYIKAGKYLTIATNLHPEPVYYDKLSYIEANLALIASYQGEKDLAAKFLTSSQLSSLKALRSSPKNIQYWKTSAKNNLVYYQITLDKKYIETGLSSVQTAMEFAPTEPKLPYTEAVLYSVLSGEELDKKTKLLNEEYAAASAKKALKLKPNYVNAREFLKKMVKE